MVCRNITSINTENKTIWLGRTNITGIREKDKKNYKGSS